MDAIQRLNPPGLKNYKVPNNGQFFKGLKEGWITYDPSTHKLVMGRPTDRLGLPIHCPLDYNNKRLTVELRGSKTASDLRGDILAMATTEYWVCIDVCQVRQLHYIYTCFNKVI